MPLIGQATVSKFVQFTDLYVGMGLPEGRSSNYVALLVELCFVCFFQKKAPLGGGESVCEREDSRWHCKLCNLSERHDWCRRSRIGAE